MAEGLIILGRVLCIALISGFGPYLWLSKGIARHAWLRPPLVAALGLGLVAGVALSLLYLSKPLLDAVPIATAISCILALATLIFAKDRRPSTELISQSISWFSLAFVLCAVVSQLPSLFHGGRQPYRVGIDQVGYAVTAQYLRDGGTITSLKSEMLRLSGKPSLGAALSANMTILDFNKATAAEFLLKSERSGYPALLAALSCATGIRKVIAFQFLVLFIPIWLASAVFGFFLTTFFNFKQWVAVLWSAAFTLNCNLLNVLYEGQHAQVFAAPFLALVFTLWYQWRTRSSELFTRGAVDDFAIAAVSMLVVFIIYSEQLVVLGVLGAIVVGLDIVFPRTANHKSSLLLLTAALSAIFASGPYGLEWVSFITRHVAHVAEGVSGFWQPQWAQVTDIIGFNNMYTIATPSYVGRPWFVSILLTTFSIIAIEVSIVCILRRRDVSYALWLAPLLFIIVIFINSFYFWRTINYNYMKSYTLLLFPLMLFTGKLIFDLVRTSKHPCRHEWLLIVAPVVSILVGTSYLSDYLRNGNFVASSVDKFAGSEASKMLATNTVVTLRPDSMHTIMLSGYVDLNWLNLGWSDPYLVPYAGKKVFLLATRHDVNDFKAFSSKFNDNVIYKDDDFLVLDLNKRVIIPGYQQLGGTVMPTEFHNRKGYFWPLELTPIWDEMLKSVMELTK